MTSQEWINLGLIISGIFSLIVLYCLVQIATNTGKTRLYLYMLILMKKKELEKEGHEVDIYKLYVEADKNK
jgi:hypothetical protein